MKVGQPHVVSGTTNEVRSDTNGMRRTNERVSEANERMSGPLSLIKKKPEGHPPPKPPSLKHKIKKGQSKTESANQSHE